MPTILSDLPEELILRLCDQASSTLYPTCRSVVEKVRRVVRSVTVRYLHSVDQLHHYPKLTSVCVYAVDLRNHTLHDYLPSSVTSLSLKNVSLTNKLFTLIPDHVLSLELNMRETMFAGEGSNQIYGINKDWANGHHQEFNLPDPDYSLLHRDLKKLRIGSVTVWGNKLNTSNLIAADYNRDQGDQDIPDNFEEWYDADLIYPCKNHLSTNLRVVYADFIRFEPGYTLADVLPSLESFRLSHVHATNDIFSVLPVNLTDFRVGMNSTPELMTLLKKSKITSLAMNKVDTKSLWEGLKKLYITSYNDVTVLSLGDLPRSLRHFSVHSLVITPSAGNGWPCLESLSIGVYLADEHSPLPDTIRSLNVPYNLWQLAKNDGLRPTSLSVIRREENPEPYIHSLPDSITSLQVHYSHLYQVPPNVKYLSLRSMTGYIPPLPEGLLVLEAVLPIEIVPSLVEAFPRSLRELILSDSNVPIQCIRYLPPKLIRLDVSQWVGDDPTLAPFPKSLAVLQSSYTDLKEEEMRHPALCHAYSIELEQ